MPNIQIVSVDANGGPSISGSQYPSMSNDGRFIVFQTPSDNLISGDTNGESDIYLKDMLTGEIERISLYENNGRQTMYGHGNDIGNENGFAPAISSDGRYIVFVSYELLDTDYSFSNIYKDRVFLFDVTNNSITLSSRASSNTSMPTISPNGIYIASADGYVLDRSTNNHLLFASSSSGTPSSNTSAYGVALSDNGLVVFVNFASNLIVGDTNGTFDIFIKNLATGITSLVSKNAEGVQANESSYSPNITPDGRYVVFQSYADNLISGADGGVFVKDLVTSEIKLASSSASGTPGVNSSKVGFTDISDDGRFVVFTSDAKSLVSDDTNSNRDIFVKDMQTGQIALVSRSDLGVLGNADSYESSISGDGHYISFRSEATNLVTGDINGKSDIFRAVNPLTENWTFGSTANDTLSGGSGNIINGGLGVDTVTYTSHQSLSQNSDGSWAIGSDTLKNIERIDFGSVKIALDMGSDENGGKAAKFINAAFGSDFISNKTYVGAGLGYLDSGMSVLALAQLCESAGLLGSSNTTFVQNVWQNVMGSSIDNASLQSFVGLLNNQTYSKASLLALAVDLDQNEAKVDLVGLQQTGLEFV